MSIQNEANPVALFGAWYAEAKACQAIKEPSATTLATVGGDGMPAARTVLLKSFGEDGFVFYTNLESEKARHLAANPNAALCFYWMPLDRQVRLEGPVAPVSAAEADAYFAGRARDSQIGAWASKQSQPLKGRFELEKRVAKYALKFGAGAVPRPSFWSGFALRPRRIEFWLKQPFRLHDRIEYTRAGGAWESRRLYP